jgi:hypothetical protein
MRPYVHFFSTVGHALSIAEKGQSAQYHTANLPGSVNYCWPPFGTDFDGADLDASPVAVNGSACR